MSDLKTPPSEDAAAEPEQTATPPPEPGLRLPVWAPWAVAGVLALAVIGLAVGLFVKGGGGGSSAGSGDDARAAESIRQMTGLLFGQQSGQPVDTHSTVGKLSPGLPSDLPSYPGARIVTSNSVESAGQSPFFFVVSDTSDSQKSVADYFTQALDSDPWKLMRESQTQESIGLQFQRSDGSQSGVVMVGRPEGQYTTIMTIFGDEQAQASTPAFTPGPNQDLPAGFPADLPVYPGANVAETAFDKTAGPVQYRVSLLTKDSDSQVLDYYRSKLQDSGYQVSDHSSASSSGASGTPSADSTPAADTTPTALDISNSDYQGTISTGAASEDPSYTQVVIQLQASGQ